MPPRPVPSSRSTLRDRRNVTGFMAFRDRTGVGKAGEPSLAVVVWSLAFASSCGDEAPGGCDGLLPAYCAPEECPDFTAAVEQAEAMVAADQPRCIPDDLSEICTQWTAWECGVVGVVMTSPTRFYGWTEYFDRSTGRLLAASRFEDFRAFCDGTSNAKYWSLPGVVVDPACDFPDCFTGGSRSDLNLCSE